MAELKLISKPKRPAFQKEVEQAKQRAYERAFKQTAKEVAQAEGAAAGVAAAANASGSSVAGEVANSEQRAYERSFKQTSKEIAASEGAEAGAAAAGAGGSALDRARQRALAGSQDSAASVNRPSAAPNPGSPIGATVQPTKPSGEFIQRPDGSRVPREYYSLSSEDRASFDALLKEEERNAAGVSQFDRVSLAVLDQQAAQAKRISALESQLSSVLTVLETMQRKQNTIDTTIEVNKSEALAGHEVEIGQMATNLLMIKMQAADEVEQYTRLRETTAAEVQEQLEELKVSTVALENRLEGARTIYEEGIIANQDKLEEVNSGMRSMAVRVSELEGRTDAIGNPITRAEMQSMVTSTVAAEFPLQLPAMVSKELAVQKATGELGEGIEIDRGYLAQSLETSDQRSKRFEVSQQQIAEAQFTNPTEAAIARALKKGGRG